MALDWEVFCQDTITTEVVAGCFGSGQEETYLEWMLRSWSWTIGVSLAALTLALVIGSIIGVMRTLPNHPVLRGIATAWTEVFRNIPLLVQIFLWYHVIPTIIPVMHSVPPFALVVCGIGFFTSSRIAEQVRSGIEALPRGQRYAGMALGLTTPQYYRHVLLPMAYRIVLPAINNEATNIVKNSAAAFAVSIPELTQFAMQAGEETARPIEIYLGVTVLYIITALVVTFTVMLIERKTRIPGFIAGGAK